MFRAVAVWLALGNVCYGLIIEYHGTTQIPAGNGMRREWPVSDGESVLLAIDISSYEVFDWGIGPAETADCNRLRGTTNCQTYIMHIRDIHGRTEGNNVGWVEYYYVPWVDYFGDARRDGSAKVLISSGAISTPSGANASIGYRIHLNNADRSQSDSLQGSFVNLKTPLLSQATEPGNRPIDVASGRFSRLPKAHLGYGTVRWQSVTITHDDLLPGDANADGVFDQLDIVQVSQAGRYLNGDRVPWSQGDWNADGVFDQRDIMAAQRTGYSAGDVAAKSVPEPHGIVIILLALAIMLIWWTMNRKLT